MPKGHLVGATNNNSNKQQKKKPKTKQRKSNPRVKEKGEELNSGEGTAWNLKTSLVPFMMLLSPNPSPIVSKKYTIPFPPDPYSVIR